jgi:hypothetical protein
LPSGIWPASFRDLDNLHTLNTAVMTMNRHWPSTMKLATRNDKTGLWDFEVLNAATPAEPGKAAFSQHGVQPEVEDDAAQIGTFTDDNPPGGSSEKYK